MQSSERQKLVKKKGLKDKWLGLLLLVPAFAIIGGVLIFSLVDAYRISFTNLNLLGFKGKFIGLENYTKIFQSALYGQILIQTFAISTISVTISFVVGLGLALIVNNIKGRAIVRGLLVLPWLVPHVIVGIIWLWLLDTDIGVVNYLLRTLGMVTSRVPWVADIFLARIAVIIAFVWVGTPFIMVVMLAGLQSIPSEIIEASVIDGAGRSSIFRFITLPLLRPLIAITTLLSIVYIFQNFAVIYMLTKGGPGYATEIFSLFVYETAFASYHLGKACAIGVSWMLLLLVFTIFYIPLVGGKEKVL